MKGDAEMPISMSCVCVGNIQGELVNIAGVRWVGLACVWVARRSGELCIPNSVIVSAHVFWVCSCCVREFGSLAWVWVVGRIVGEP